MDDLDMKRTDTDDPVAPVFNRCVTRVCNLQQES